MKKITKQVSKKGPRKVKREAKPALVVNAQALADKLGEAVKNDVERLIKRFEDRVATLEQTVKALEDRLGEEVGALHDRVSEVEGEKGDDREPLADVDDEAAAPTYDVPPVAIDGTPINPEVVREVEEISEEEKLRAHAEAAANEGANIAAQSRELDG